MNDVYDQAIAELEQALAELAALRQQLAALRDSEYLHHKWDCDIQLAFIDEPKCTCGLAELLTSEQGTASPAPASAVHDSPNQARTPTRVKESA